MKRIVVKFSGEGLSNKKDFLIDEEYVKSIGYQIKEIIDKKDQVSIIIGGGNIFRGRNNNTISRIKSDQIGMLSTVINCIYVSEIFKGIGLKTSIYSPFKCSSFTKCFSIEEVEEDLNNNKVVFFAGGTGHPYFSTDTITILRAIEIKADLVLFSKSIDGIYSDDPKKNKKAKKYKSIKLKEIIDKRLEVIDLTAAIMANNNNIQFCLFQLNKENSILNALNGISDGTYVTV